MSDRHDASADKSIHYQCLRVYHDIFALRPPGFMSSVVGLPENWYLALRDLGGEHFIIDGVAGYFI
ncbi:hypothetical protein Desfe_1063 [Desulfurococcus amylolyticus DSM 16532]|uniref:Uncharacterized protein n=1 Tax=Desulfurococcus amylolyticus DSM 16532 TaxID=768672 RepID=I3XSL1_DESAM|nr:hypothetical protein Desfe_1063 [Desulfurococcus amylolyticus DSM 16532]